VSVGVTYPRGFRAAGIAAGFKPSGKPDLALLLTDGPAASAAGVFTTNRVAAAPVTVGRSRLASSGGSVRAVVVNSGQANAATGERGITDAETTTAALAELLGTAPDEVLPCSTGVIGEPLHVDVFVGALPALIDAASTDGGDGFARAIMTTDTVPKCATADAGPWRVGGAAKGVGMIAPNLATMLAFVTTDATVAAEDLGVLARTALAPAFDAITVDGCSSTNDTVLLLASGASGGEPPPPGSSAWSQLEEAVATVGADLARQLIADGEGVTHVLVIDVEGAGSDVDARTIARAIADSPLVKTAAFGADPNPGRVLQAVGSAGVPVDPVAIDVAIGDVEVATGSVIPPAYFDADGELRRRASAAMAGPEILLRVKVGDGPGRSRMLGGDLSYEYVRINGEYTT
jgi:glutamate N-acetyltransferase/amino-acid N-acetyltransferase